MVLAPHTGCDGSTALRFFSWVENVGPKTLQGGKVTRSHMWEHSPGGGRRRGWQAPGFGPGVMSCRGHMDRTAEGCVLSWLRGPQQGGAAPTPHVFMLPRRHGKLTHWEWPCVEGTG